MQLRRHQELIAATSARKGVTRRHFLQTAGALGLAASFPPAAVLAQTADEGEGLGPFGPWSSPVNLGPVINTRFDEYHPAISKDGLSLYITSKRPGGVNGANPASVEEIWVSQRDSRDADWGPPVNLDAFNAVPIINSVNTDVGVPSFSADGHLMFFHRGNVGGADLYVSRRTNKHNDFGWREPVNLDLVNSPQDDTAATYFEDEETGIISLYITSNRPGGPVGSLPGSFHIWVSTQSDDRSFGPAVLVPELSSPYSETRTTIRRDGLELFLGSSRPNGLIGKNDIWVSTRDSTLDPWGTPVTLGPTVNYPGFQTGAPALSWDGTTLYFYSNRPGGFGGRDLYVSTRERFRG